MRGPGDDGEDGVSAGAVVLVLAEATVDGTTKLSLKAVTKSAGSANLNAQVESLCHVSKYQIARSLIITLAT